MRKSVAGVCLLLLVCLLGAETQQTLNLNMNSRRIVSLGSPTADTDATTRGYVLNTMPWWGDGSDGAVSISAGTTTMTRDMHYTTLTISSTGKLNTAGFRVHCSTSLDLSNAPANAITWTANNGNNASGATQGSGGGALSTAGLGGSLAGSNGGAGSTSTPNNGSSAGTSAQGNGGSAAAGGAGGTSGGAGGTAGSANASSTRPLKRATFDLLYGASVIVGGTGGSGGGSGRGDGSNNSGAGGGGGGGSGVVWIAARSITRGGSTTAAAISSPGGTGGNGGN